MAITKRMREIAEAYSKGLSLEEIAVQYEISVGSVKKKIDKVRRADATINTPKLNERTKPSEYRQWSIESVKSGIDRYIAENGSMPIAYDFDSCEYLPSARQMQRSFGGLTKLRETLGYKDIDFTKGKLRGKIASAAGRRGLSAEDYFEPLLIEQFGEPYVHVQKRYYKGSKNRYDFLIYAKNRVFGIDIFTTNRVEYIANNVRHKISRYRNAPTELVIYFVLVGSEYTPEDVQKVTHSLVELSSHPNMLLLHESTFLKLITSFESLTKPSDFLGLESIEI